MRPGGITREMIEDVIGAVEVDKRVLTPPKEGDRVRSPGMKYTHYAPKAPVIIVDGNIDNIKTKVKDRAREYSLSGKRVVVLATEETASMYEDGDFMVFVMGVGHVPYDSV